MKGKEGWKNRQLPKSACQGKGAWADGCRWRAEWNLLRLKAPAAAKLEKRLQKKQASRLIFSPWLSQNSILLLLRVRPFFTRSALFFIPLFLVVAPLFFLGIGERLPFLFGRSAPHEVDNKGKRNAGCSHKKRYFVHGRRLE